MKKLFRLLVGLLEFSLIILLVGLFSIQYIYPDILTKLCLTFKQVQLIIMALGAITIAILGQRRLSLFWRIASILISLLIVIETYIMCKCSS
jgi:hypothetical protein